MGISIPNYTKMAPQNPNGGPIVPQTIQDAYLSLRCEHILFQQNSDGTYNITGRAKIYANKNDNFTVDTAGYAFNVTKDQLNMPLHQLVYQNLKAQYPGSTDSP